MEDKASEIIEWNEQYEAALSLFNDALVNDGSLRLCEAPRKLIIILTVNM